MRVLIVRIGAMGDVLHAMPAVAALRARHPTCFIGWAIEPRWSDLLQISGDLEDLSQGIGPAAPRALVDRWYSVPTGAWKKRPLAPDTLGEIDVLRRVLREEHFDVCVDLQGSVKSALVGKMAGAAVFIGPDEPRERLARWMYRHRVPTTTAHVVEQACELLGTAIGEPLLPAKVTLPMDAEDELWADEIVWPDGAARSQTMVLIAPTAGWGAKEWPAERYGAVAAEFARTGARILVNATGPEDPAAAAVIAASHGSAEAISSSVGQLIALVRRASVVIAGDTGPLHLAAALERPVVGIFGPTSPRRNGPWRTRSSVLRDSESVTSHKHTGDAEPGMLRISVADVVTAAREILASRHPITRHLENL